MTLQGDKCIMVTAMLAPAVLYVRSISESVKYSPSEPASSC